MGLYEKLQRGQVVHVQVLNGERQFHIRPKRFAGVTGYFVIVNGRVDPAYAGGKILDTETVRDWCNHLIDLDEEKEPCYGHHEHHDSH